MMNKILKTGDIAHQIAEKLDLSPKDVEAVLKEFQVAVIAQMETGGEVRLLNFGTFKTINNEPRRARNPLTGEVLEFSASPSVVFVPGKKLKSLGG